MPGTGNLGRRHLGEILALQHLLIRHRETAVDVDLGRLLPRLILKAREQRFLDPSGSRLRFRRRAGSLRQQHRQHLVEIAAPAEKQPERLVEQHRVLVLAHEHRMQRPVEVAAPTEARNRHGFKRIEHRAGSDRDAGSPQRAGEIHDVLGEPAGRG